MKDLKWIKEGYFAHRGLHNKNIPENTMAAFKNAKKHGFDIELDIRITKDKQIVVFHDKNMKRLCGKDVFVKDLNYDEIKDFPIRNTKETPPLLSEVFETLPTNTQYLIELKPVDNYKVFVAEFIKLLKNYDIKYAIHSFDARIVHQFKKQDRSIIRGQIASTFKEEKAIYYKLLKHCALHFITKPDFTNYDFDDLPRKKLDKLHKKGHTVISYVARSQKGLDFVRNRYDNAVFENFIPKK